MKYVRNKDIKGSKKEVRRKKLPAHYRAHQMMSPADKKRYIYYQGLSILVSNDLMHTDYPNEA
ncbi:hypothetical protein [Motilimonas sp. KMU-193]|uniref:hypothetical protein n=1 Tax=Motilimonas sp. KMU-193 TaxID=3388668 RepID=UPI00396B4475